MKIKKYLQDLIKTLGSVRFALWLIAGLAVVLMVSTILESAHGTPFVQRFFYQASWFNAFLALVGVNMFCALLSRFPLKRNHTGFALTHIGAVTLLVGSLLSSLFGIEGQMALNEGEARREMLVPGRFTVSVHTPEHQDYGVDFDKFVKQKQWRFGQNGRFRLKLNEWMDSARHEDVIANSESAEENHAVHLVIKSQMAGLEESLWLLENHPTRRNADHMDMGPAEFLLRRAHNSLSTTNNIQSPTLTIRETHSKKSQSIEFPLKNSSSELTLDHLGVKLTRINYFPDARVGDKNELVSVSSEPSNPALTFDLVTPSGTNQSFVKFANYPEFESIHGRKAGPSQFEAEFKAPQNTENLKPSLTIFFPLIKNMPWTFESRSKKGTVTGNIEPGKTSSTGWMDFSFTAGELLDHAVVEKKVTKADKSSDEGCAANFTVFDENRALESQWVFQDVPAHFAVSEGLVTIGLQQKSAALPFSLSLRDFRKVDYPGTNSAASFESDVTLENSDEGLMLRKTISMNKPLDYKHYRIFQSSFIQDPAMGETSVFTIAKNPGVWLIYTGAIVMFLGVILVFWVKPFSSLPKELR